MDNNTDHPSEPRWECDAGKKHSNPAPAETCGMPGCGLPRH